MFKTKTRNLLIFLSFVSFIYVLRGGSSSPVTFLARQASRILEDRAITAKLCSGVSVYPSTSGEKSRAEKITNNLKNLRNGNPMIEFIQGPDSKDEFAKEYAVPLIKFSAPWIAFFAIGVLGFIGCGINCCCMCCTRRCGCIKACKRPTTTKYTPFLKISSLVLMTLLIGTSIAGLIFSQDVRVGGHQTICSLGMLVENLLEGVNDANWLGLSPIIDNMTYLFDGNRINVNAASMTGTYPQASTDQNDITTEYNDAKTAVTNMQNNNAGKQATRPDQSAGSLYTPTYITDLSDHTTGIQTEIDTKYNLMNDGITDITQGISKINDVNNYLTAAIQPIIMQKLNDASKSAGDFGEKIKDNGSTGQNGVKAIAGGLIGVFSVELISAIVAIGSIILVKLGKFAFNKAIYGSCFCLSILMILGWVLSAILLPTGIILIEGCETTAKLQTDPVFYNQVFDKFFNEPSFTQARNILFNCLFEDGDVLTEIGIRNYFDGHQQLFDGLDSTYTLTEVNGVTIPDSVVIPKEQTLVSNYKTGLVSDADATTTDLKKLNKYTNSGTNPCTSLDDTWILNSDLCKNMGTVFQSSSADDFNLNNPTCIGFDAWGTSHAITNRYSPTTLPQPACGKIDASDAHVTLDAFVTSFVQSRADVDDIFGDVETSLTNVATANTDFMGKVRSATTNIDASMGPRKTIAPIYVKLGDAKTGILPNGNCKWVIASLNQFQDVMCNRFITGVYQAAIVIIIASFFAMFGSLALFCLAKKHLVEKKNNKHQYEQAKLSPQGL